MRTMIKLLMLIMLNVFCFDVHAQNLRQARVYFDNNSNGYQYISLSNQTAIDQPFTVDVSSLTRGMHVMYIEVKDNNGRWSFYDRENIQIQGGLQMAVLGRAEYFFDNDPGIGQGIQIPLANDTVIGSFDLDLDGLSNGMHMAYIRVRDNANQWSLYAQRLFQVVGSMNQEIVEVEYYFDTDPGLGNGTPIALTAFTGSADLELSLDGLANGVHTLYIRVKDANGLWSFYDQANFTVTNPVPNSYLVVAEYYFDTDPGEGNAIPLIIPQSNFVDGDFELDIPSNLSNGNHTVCIRVLNGAGYWSAVSCEVITICQIPVPSIVASGNACTDGYITLSVNSAVYDTYTWSGGGQGTSIQVSTPGTYTLTVNDNGCSAQATIDAQFTVVPQPTVVVSGNACPGGEQLITITNDYDSYTWPDGSTASSYAVTTAGNYAVTLVSGECSLTEVVPVTFVNPVAPVITQVGNACEGELVTLSVPANTPGILWSTGSQASSITVSNSSNIGVSAINQGCPVQASTEVVFSTLPVVQITSTGGPCASDVVLLEATAGYDDYVWSNGIHSNSIEVTTGGNYSVQVFNGDCSVIESIPISFISITTPTISTNQNTLACDQAGFAYQWYLNGSPIPGATAQFYSATQSGFYAVEITQNGCSATSAVLNFTLIGVEETTAFFLSAWPNPSNGIIYLQSNEVMESVSIVDIQGKWLDQLTPKSTQVTLKLEHLPAGLYMLKVKTPTSVQIIKAMIQ